jgi:hypothetical protein
MPPSIRNALRYFALGLYETTTTKTSNSALPEKLKILEITARFGNVLNKYKYFSSTYRLNIVF